MCSANGVVVKGRTTAPKGPSSSCESSALIPPGGGLVSEKIGMLFGNAGNAVFSRQIFSRSSNRGIPMSNFVMPPAIHDGSGFFFMPFKPVSATIRTRISFSGPLADS